MNAKVKVKVNISEEINLKYMSIFWLTLINILWSSKKNESEYKSESSPLRECIKINWQTENEWEKTKNKAKKLLHSTNMNEKN